MSNLLEALLPKPTDTFDFNIAAILSSVLVFLMVAGAPLAVWANQGHVTPFLIIVMTALYAVTLLFSALWLRPLGPGPILTQMFSGFALYLGVFFTHFNLEERPETLNLGLAFTGFGALALVVLWSMILGHLRLKPAQPAAQPSG